MRQRYTWIRASSSLAYTDEGQPNHLHAGGFEPDHVVYRGDDGAFYLRGRTYRGNIGGAFKTIAQAMRYAEEV